MEALRYVVAGDSCRSQERQIPPLQEDLSHLINQAEADFFFRFGKKGKALTGCLKLDRDRCTKMQLTANAGSMNATKSTRSVNRSGCILP